MRASRSQESNAEHHYNIMGNNARVHQNTVDNSTNKVQADALAIRYINT